MKSRVSIAPGTAPRWSASWFCPRSARISWCPGLQREGMQSHHLLSCPWTWWSSKSCCQSQPSCLASSWPTPGELTSKPSRFSWWRALLSVFSPTHLPILLSGLMLPWLLWRGSQRPRRIAFWSEPCPLPRYWLAIMIPTSWGPWELWGFFSRGTLHYWCQEQSDGEARSDCSHCEWECPMEISWVTMSLRVLRFQIHYRVQLLSLQAREPSWCWGWHWPLHTCWSSWSLCLSWDLEIRLPLLR